MALFLLTYGAETTWSEVYDVTVVDDGKPVGIVTDRDIVVRGVVVDLDVDSTPVSALMSESIHTVHGNGSL